MKDSGVAIMGTASAEGENRAIEAAEKALSSPLLNDNDITGAKQILLNITFGDLELTMDEMSEITDFIVDAAGGSAEMIMGQGYDETLGDKVCVTIIATGFQSNSSVDTGVTPEEPKKNYLDLGNDESTMISKPITSPTQSFETKATPVAENEEVMPYLKSETTPAAPTEPANEVKEEMSMERIIKQEQATFNFENSQPIELKEEVPVHIPAAIVEPKKEERIIHYLEDDLEEETPVNETPVNEIPSTPVNNVVEKNTVEEISREQQQQMNEGRRERIQELSMKLRTPFGLSELENEPAYIRRKIKLEDTPHSSESEVSRFTLSEEEGQDGKTSGTIRSNNSFLHDNVD